MNVLQKIALVIVIIGAVNWLLIGIFDFNLVAFIFDDLSTVISRIIYSLVGIAGLRRNVDGELCGEFIGCDYI